MNDWPARTDPEEAAIGRPTQTARRLVEASVSPNTRRAYAGALRRLDAWLAGRELDDAALATYLAELHDAGRAASSASMAVAAACFRAKLAGELTPAGERTARVLAGYRRTASDRGRGQARPFGASDLAAVLATCHRPRRRGRGVESEEVALERGRLDAVIAGLLFMAGMRRSEVSALRWADIVDSTDGDGILVTVRRSKTNQEGDVNDVRFVKDGVARALRTLRAATSPEPGDRVMPLSAQMIGLRFTAAALAAGVESRVTAHSGRVGLASQLTSRGASTTDVMLAGNWKTSRMVAHYSAGATAERGAVARYLYCRTDGSRLITSTSDQTLYLQAGPSRLPFPDVVSHLESLSMQRLHLPFGLRAVPLRRSLVIEQRRAQLDFAYALGSTRNYIFSVDIYAYNDPRHPERHLGWWRFELPRQHRRGRLAMSLDPVSPSSVGLTVAGDRVPVGDCWVNSDFVFDPLGELQLVMRGPTGEIARLEPVLLKFTDRDILRAFYERQYTTEGYTSAADAPFLPELHHYKMRRLLRLFERYIPKGRALDVGCGRSLFADMNVPFPFQVYAGDLDFGSIHDRAADVPHQTWSVFDAEAVPFQDGSFEALFAGEIIEHVANVQRALQEWWRVLKPGGVAIITTPNRNRLVALADGLESPYSADHLNELSYRALTRELLPACGFEFVEQDCLYLELWTCSIGNGSRITFSGKATEPNTFGRCAGCFRSGATRRGWPWD